METSLFFVPLLGAAMLSVFGVCFQLKIAARASAYVASGAAISVSIVSFLGAALLSMKYLSHVRILGFPMPWCSMMEHAHVETGTVTGTLSTIVVLFGTFRAVQFFRSVHRARLVTQELRSLTSNPILVEPDDAMYAYSVPGSVPLTILSSGLVQQLNDFDRGVVLAHEAAHHKYRHGRFLFVGRLATALFAPTWFLTRGLEHALERWADDYAATVVGDRKSVALVVARVSLGSLDHRVPLGVLAFGAAGPFSTTQRVRSLLRPPQTIPVWVPLLAVAIVAGLLTQLYHFEGMLSSLCQM